HLCPERIAASAAGRCDREDGGGRVGSLQASALLELSGQDGCEVDRDLGMPAEEVAEPLAVDLQQLAIADREHRGGARVPGEDAELPDRGSRPQRAQHPCAALTFDDDLQPAGDEQVEPVGGVPFVEPPPLRLKVDGPGERHELSAYRWREETEERSGAERIISPHSGDGYTVP